MPPFADGGFAAAGFLPGFSLSTPRKLRRIELAGVWLSMRAALPLKITVRAFAIRPVQCLLLSCIAGSKHIATPSVTTL